MARAGRALRLAAGAAALSIAWAVIGATGAASEPAPRLWGDRPSVDQLTALGRAMFVDKRLSADGRLACASCHDPATAFGPNAHTPSPFSDGDPAHDGTRAIPSLRYVQFIGRFTEHTADDEETHGVDGGPTGGLTWDGRADNVRGQARIPLFAAHEMGNADDAALARRVKRAPYAAAFRRAFSAPGRDVFAAPRRVVAWMALALEVYQQGREFAPFDSRYDRWLARRAELTPQELRGLALFRDPAKGNCDACHPSRRSSAGAAPLFTDAGFVAIGAPRRAGLPPLAANASAASQPTGFEARGAQADLGLCRSGRQGLSDDRTFCGRFRAPSLRNVALRASFFHNGGVRTLREAVAFYATRDTDPGHWYPHGIDGQVRLYDDLPADLADVVNHEPPFQPLADGRPRLDDDEIDDLVAFLRTLTDADAQALAP